MFWQRITSEKSGGRGQNAQRYQLPVGSRIPMPFALSEHQIGQFQHHPVASPFRINAHLLKNGHVVLHQQYP
jgi:hypothetical protein